MNDFDIVEKMSKLGDGAYGIVYKVKSKKSMNEAALKINLVDHHIDFMGSLRELDLLVRVRGHPNVVELLSVQVGEVEMGTPASPVSEDGVKNDKLHFIFEPALGDLTCFLDELSSFRHVKTIMLQLLLGLKFLHMNGIVHRDIKPQNILVFKDKEGTPIVKYCDFGMSKFFSYQGNQTPGMVTSWYRPPEICLDEPYYDYKIDIWSLGCVFFEIVKCVPFIVVHKDKNAFVMKKIIQALPPSKREDEIKEKSKKLLGATFNRNRKSFQVQQKLSKSKIATFDKMPGGSYVEYLSLLQGMMEFFPSDRFCINECLRHPFSQHFKEVVHDFELENHKKDDDPIIEIPNSEYRLLAAGVINDLFNERDRHFWYKHRILFQTLDIYDRCLIKLGSEGKMELRVYVCLYISVKYFNSYSYSISYTELTPEEYLNCDLLEEAEELEKKIVAEVLKYQIYRNTVYEAATEYLDDLRVRNLLMIYGTRNEFSGKTTSEIYKHVRAEVFDGVYGFI